MRRGSEHQAASVKEIDKVVGKGVQKNQSSICSCLVAVPDGTM